MGLKELVPILEDRLPIILAGNPFEVSLPYSPPPGIVDGFPIGVITHRAATDHLAPLTRLFKFDFARDPETNLVPFDLTDIMPYLPGLEPAFPDPSQVVIFPWDIIREVNVALEIEFDVDREDNLPLSSEKFAVIGAGTAGRLAFLYGQEYLRTGLAETLQFLTHQPEEKPILFDQPDFAYYLHNLAKEESLYLKVMYEDLQGTWQAWEPEASQFDAKSYGVYCIPCGPSQLRLPESARRYEVAIVNAQNQRLSHVRTYHIDYTPYENAKVLFFQNSFGVFDSISLTGESITKGTYESKVSPLLKAGFNQPQSRTTYRKEKVERTYQTGQYPPGWKAYFSELLRSKRIALYQDGIFQYVNVSNADAELTNTHEPSYSLEITLSSEDASSYNAL